jgi:hypothetical protein
MAAVRITGAAGMVEGGRASLKVGNHKPIAVSVIWVAGKAAVCRLLGHPDPEAFEAMMGIATSIDRTVIAPRPCDNKSR